MNNKLTWEDSLKTRTSLTFRALKSENPCDLFLSSSSDIGVMRNGGKRGSRFSPQTLTGLFSKMIAPSTARSWNEIEVSNSQLEIKNFPEGQRHSIETIKNAITNSGQDLKHLIHIGGGHDHIYPLVKAWSEVKTNQPKKNIVIINIDAHLDSRVDEFAHSGTPFRQLNNELGAKLHLYQIGIHSYANAEANYKKMKNMEVAPSRELKNSADWLIEILSNHSEDQLILSLDCDGLDQSFMPAVSAPNHSGLTANEMDEILKVCLSYWKATTQTPIFGLYEYNPVFDNIGVTAGRYLSSLIYQFLYP